MKKNLIGFLMLMNQTPHTLDLPEAILQTKIFDQPKRESDIGNYMFEPIMYQKKTLFRLN